VTATLIDNIGLLVESERERPNAALVYEDGLISWIGESSSAPATDTRIDAGGRCVIPGFVDTHSHLMFAGDRTDEFVSRMAGRKYEAGGIRSTVAATRAASDTALLLNATRLVDEMRAQGTTTVEIKSGYGLTTADEARSLALASRLTSETTYLGAHVVPIEYVDDVASYVELVKSAHSTSIKHGPSLLRGSRAGWAPECMPDNSANPRGCDWQWNSARPRSTTAPSCQNPISTISPRAALLPRSSPGSSSRLASRIRTHEDCSPQG